MCHRWRVVPRIRGLVAPRQLTIPMTSATAPGNPARVDMQVMVSGKRTAYKVTSRTPTPMIAYERRRNGTPPANVRPGYEYHGCYAPGHGFEGNRVVAEHSTSGSIVSPFLSATRSHVPDSSSRAPTSAARPPRIPVACGRRPMRMRRGRRRRSCSRSATMRGLYPSPAAPHGRATGRFTRGGPRIPTPHYRRARSFRWCAFRACGPRARRLPTPLPW